MVEAGLSTSVVIPVLDDADQLARCLAALFVQTLPPDEVIVVDNGSTDGSRAVATTWGARVLDEPRRGIPSAASTGYDAAASELILRLDADSVPPPDWTERVVAAFAAEPQLDALTGPGRMRGLPRGTRHIAHLAYMSAYFLVMGAALTHPPLFGSNFAMRRSAWARVRDEVHRDDAYMHDDVDLSIHLGPAHRIRVDRSLQVDISSRPLRDAGSMVVRFRRGVYTLREHPGEGPIARRSERLRAWWRERSSALS